MIKFRQENSVTSFEMSRAPLGRPLRKVFCFLTDGLLIETGPPCCARELTGILARHNVRQAVVSHLHEDHAGGVPWLNRVGIAPLASTLAHDYLTSPGPLPFYRWLAFGSPRPGRVLPLAETISTENRTFRVIPTPGHSSDHSVFLEPQQGWLFTGDLFVSDRVLYLYKRENLAEILASIDKVLKLDFSTIYCSHSGVIPEGKARLAKKRDNLLNLAEQARTLRRRGLGTRAIADSLLGSPGLIYLISRGEFSKENLIKAILEL